LCNQHSILFPLHIIVRTLDNEQNSSVKIRQGSWKEVSKGTQKSMVAVQAVDWIGMVAVVLAVDISTSRRGTA
jgi:hypothetical protein